MINLSRIFVKCQMMALFQTHLLLQLPMIVLLTNKFHCCGNMLQPSPKGGSSKVHEGKEDSEQPRCRRQHEAGSRVRAPSSLSCHVATVACECPLFALESKAQSLL